MLRRPRGKAYSASEWNMCVKGGCRGTDWVCLPLLVGSLSWAELYLFSSVAALSSTPNWGTFSILPFIFPPSAQHSSQPEVCPFHLFSRVAVLGTEDEEGRWAGVGREAAPWVGLLPTCREHRCVCRLQPPTGMGGEMLKSLFSSYRHCSQAASFRGNI